MSSLALYTFATIVVATLGGFIFGRSLVLVRLETAGEALSTLPNYFGYYSAWMIGGAALLALVIGLLLGAPSLAIASTNLITIIAMYMLSWRQIRPTFPARQYVEKLVIISLGLCSVIAVLTTLGIILSLLVESLRFFREVSLLDFLTGLQWSPQTALRADQTGQSGAFGAIPVLLGTFLIMAVAMGLAGPIGLLIAIYLSEYASRRVRQTIKPALEILAGIPTVVYGFFALLTVGPMIRTYADTLGFSVPTQSAIAAGSVMGVMIIPYISSLSDDVISAVPQSLRDGSYALGATKSETVFHVIFSSALPGLMSSFLLAISRAVGETMIVVMAAGRAANLTVNPFEAVTTVTVQIVSLLTGDQEFDSAKTLAAFALGLLLFIITLGLNIAALHVVRSYRKKYE